MSTSAGVTLALDRDAADRSARGFTMALLLLLALGLIMVVSATSLTDDLGGRPLATTRGHLVRLGLALGVFLLAQGVRPRWLFAASPLLFVTAVGLLAATLVVGAEANQARRWIDLGPLTFQPSELARVAVIVALGAWASVVRDDMARFKRGVVVPFLIMGLPAGLVFVEPDLGSAVYMLMVGVVLLWVAGARIRFLSPLFLLALAGALMYGLLNFGHVGRRLQGFTSPGVGTQVGQGLISLGSGGVTGVGLGAGRGKWGYVPEAENDFILTVVGEELGLMGSVVLILLYGLLLFHGTRLLLGVRSRFGLIVGAGLLLQVAIQALLNVAVVTALAPPKGLPMPFVSMGGTSLLVLCASCGLLLGLVRWPEEDPGQDGRWPLLSPRGGAA